MSETEVGSISRASHRVSRLCRPGFASNRPGCRRFDPFRASEDLDSGLLEIDQPLQVSAGFTDRAAFGTSAEDNCRRNGLDRSHCSGQIAAAVRAAACVVDLVFDS